MQQLEITGSSCSEFQSPTCNSSAFSLMMADSEPNPSTSGYSSEQPAKVKTQKELLRTLKELRSYLPQDKKDRDKSSTAASLEYALRCIQQVKANEEYYQLLMVNEEQPCRLDVSCYTIQEIANITSEYTKNNTDVFTVAVSLVTGRILYISEQASMVLRCGRDQFSQVRFVDLVAPQDVSVFYSSTTPYKLPSWSICNGTDSGSLESMEEKSFYCRISCGRESQKEISYRPFRLTPYLIRVQSEGNLAEQLCCVLFAERLHSGYEAPRIPADKRIFTTTHTPSCLFQDIDERAVPLLGYLPQDLIGTPIILHLHPSDRPLMIAVHKKILQYGGQPFDFSPIRFCARNGEYITIDTSWSSFINPWSRKVSFIIGRHKVRMGPVKEDVFTPPPCTEDRTQHPEIQEITEQIYQLLLQPVHNSGSSGYGSLGSNGSHENPLSAASSSDSNGNLNEDMKDKQAASPEQGVEVQLASDLRSKGQQEVEKCLQTGYAPIATVHSKNIVKESSGSCSSPEQGKDVPAKQPPYSYQQISCLDSVIRYLESCSVPASIKRKRDSPCNNKSSPASDDQIQTETYRAESQAGHPAFVTGLPIDEKSLLQTVHNLPNTPHCPSFITLAQPVSACDPALLQPILSDSSTCSLSGNVRTSLSMPGSLPCLSFPSLPVPVCRPDSALVPLSMDPKAESVVSYTSHCSYSSTIVHVGDKRLQPETEMDDNLPLMEAPSPALDVAEKEPCKRLGLTKDVLAAHTQREENDFLTNFMDIKRLNAFNNRCNSYLHERPGGPRSGLQHGPETSWKRSGKTRKAKAKRVCPESWDSSSSGLPQHPCAPTPGLNTIAWSQSGTSHTSFPPLPYPVLPAYTLPIFPPPQIPVPSETPQEAPSTSCPQQPFSTPVLPPVLAVMLPNFMYAPNMIPNLQPGATPQPSFPAQPSSYVSQPNFPSPLPSFPIPNPSFPVVQPTFPIGQPIFPTPQHSFPVQPPSFTPQTAHNLYHAQPFPYPKSPGSLKTREGLSCSSTLRDPTSPPLFQSRCSSPLQLNLLQLEEAQKAERPEGSAGPMDNGATGSAVISQPCHNSELVLTRDGSPADARTSDAVSTCSDILDILLQEDASCGTCSASSAISDSFTSGSRGNGTSESQTGSSLTSRSSKYFGSVDSSENNQQHVQASGSSGSKHIMKYILQDPMWLLMANADENVMMTYQMPQRDLDVVLRKDRERLKSLQKLQPRFTEEQKKEIGEIHPWIQRGGLPWAVDVQDCLYCRDRETDSAEYGEVIQELELSGIMEPCD
ncbi:period circadian protein homolog 2-like [Discoglossus pictus]